MATHTLLNNIQLCLNKKKACRWNTLWPAKGIWLCKPYHNLGQNEILCDHKYSLSNNGILPI
jgi:hypothetical protein